MLGATALPKRYGISKAGFYQRRDYLKSLGYDVEPKKSGRKRLYDSFQVQLFDGLDAHIKSTGTMEAFSGATETATEYLEKSPGLSLKVKSDSELVNQDDQLTRLKTRNNASVSQGIDNTNGQSLDDKEIRVKWEDENVHPDEDPARLNTGNEAKVSQGIESVNGQPFDDDPIKVKSDSTLVNQVEDPTRLKTGNNGKVNQGIEPVNGQQPHDESIKVKSDSSLVHQQSDADKLDGLDTGEEGTVHEDTNTHESSKRQQLESLHTAAQYHAAHNLTAFNYLTAEYMNKKDFTIDFLSEEVNKSEQAVINYFQSMMKDPETEAKKLIDEIRQQRNR